MCSNVSLEPPQTLFPWQRLLHDDLLNSIAKTDAPKILLVGGSKLIGKTQFVQWMLTKHPARCRAMVKTSAADTPGNNIATQFSERDDVPEGWNDGIVLIDRVDLDGNTDEWSLFITNATTIQQGFMEIINGHGDKIGGFVAKQPLVVCCFCTALPPSDIPTSSNVAMLDAHTFAKRLL
jgi:hypothetical protein